MVAYKQFKIDKSGNLHPLFVFANDIIETGKWLTAKEGKRTATGKVSSKLGPLAYRPGWHLCVLPYAPHIGIKENGKVKYMRPDTVWAECEVSDEIDYTPIARMNGMMGGNRFDSRKACLDYIPKGGFYWFTTNQNAVCDWLIAEQIRVVRIMSDAEVEICCGKHGIKAQPRKVVA